MSLAVAAATVADFGCACCVCFTTRLTAFRFSLLLPKFRRGFQSPLSWTKRVENGLKGLNATSVAFKT